MITMLDAVTTGTSPKELELRGDSLDSAFYITWSAGVSAGAVVIETSEEPGFSGVWAPIFTVTFSGSPPKKDILQVAGALNNVRARVTTDVVGGTVTVKYDGM